MDKNYTLSNGNKVSKVGFGTYKITGKNMVEQSLQYALESGYTMIDTAYYYDNETDIGDFLKGVKRDSYQIATKVWPSDYGYDNTLKSIERSLKALKVDCIDIMYLHWPGEDMESSYKALERMYDEKAIKNLALANFLPKHYEQLSKTINVKPVINQIEVHPLMSNKDNIRFYKKQGIQIFSWAPIARASKEIFEDENIIRLCQKYSKSPAQIILRWHIQQGLAVIPKSTNKERIQENISIFDFGLTDEEMKIIDSFDKDTSVSNRPDDEKWLKQMRYS